MDPLTLLLQLSNVDETLLLYNHGYKKIDNICDTLQGQLYKSITVNQSDTPQLVAIKKCEKYLFNEKLSIQNGINFCVSENICREAKISQHLTSENTPIGNYIVKYIDFFESDDCYYLVMEYIESGMNLKQLINKCKQYIHNGQLWRIQSHPTDPLTQIYVYASSIILTKFNTKTLLVLNNNNVNAPQLPNTLPFKTDIVIPMDQQNYNVLLSQMYPQYNQQTHMQGIYHIFYMHFFTSFKLKLFCCSFYIFSCIFEFECILYVCLYFEF